MIVLTADQARAIGDAAAAASPDEACGLLVGLRAADGDIRVTQVAPSANLAADRRRRFEVDPALRLRLQKALRHGPGAIVGHYHSHVDGPARPSATDLSMAFEPDLVWVIVAVADGAPGEMTAHRLAAGGGRFEPLPLMIEPAPPR